MHGPISPLALLLILAVLTSFLIAGLIVYGFYLVAPIVWKWVRGHS
jgi:hypothetical protein